MIHWETFLIGFDSQINTSVNQFFNSVQFNSKKQAVPGKLSVLGGNDKTDSKITVTAYWVQNGFLFVISTKLLSCSCSNRFVSVLSLHIPVFIKFVRSGWFETTVSAVE